MPVVCFCQQNYLPRERPSNSILEVKSRYTATVGCGRPCNGRLGFIYLESELNNSSGGCFKLSKSQERQRWKGYTFFKRQAGPPFVAVDSVTVLDPPVSEAQPCAADNSAQMTHRSDREESLPMVPMTREPSHGTMPYPAKGKGRFKGKPAAQGRFKGKHKGETSEERMDLYREERLEHLMDHAGRQEEFYGPVRREHEESGSGSYASSSYPTSGTRTTTLTLSTTGTTTLTSTGDDAEGSTYRAPDRPAPVPEGAQVAVIQAAGLHEQPESKDDQQQVVETRLKSVGGGGYGYGNCEDWL